ncbi:hypothetical protein [Noviherbaspirillum sedimenti]|uniref:Uncharacterized protein n=1 Tax=Noviherbaspirillum sedimenti TaxID=2320865 RepID=A0A3A3FZ13_9BURK|nr:hypothetical protein [Noviherbaspirillum sedimenti]RJG00964.1 hypothetical protein D3878_04650 [Noviherbaspirillum sedimenti]
MKQLELQMTHFPYQPYMAFMRVKRRALAKANTAAKWTQLELKLILRRLVKAGEWFAVAAFGREFILPTVKATAKKAARFIRAALGFK